MRRLCILLLATALLSGCAVVVVTGAVAGVAATGVGLAADAAVGTVRLGSKVVGAVAGAVLPGSSD